jgi:hypothetical protein
MSATSRKRSPRPTRDTSPSGAKRTNSRACRAWLNLDAIVPAALRADVADLRDATLDMLRAIEVWIVRAGDTALRYEAATDVRYERVDMEGVIETIDDLAGFDDVRDLLRLADAVIAAHVDPGTMSVGFDQIAKLAAEHLSTIDEASPIIGFIERAENERLRRADRREALGHLR